MELAKAQKIPGQRSGYRQSHELGYRNRNDPEQFTRQVHGHGGIGHHDGDKHQVFENPVH